MTYPPTHSGCAYLDDVQLTAVPLVAWVRAWGWRPELSGGSRCNGTVSNFPPEYYTQLYAILKRMVDEPNQDTFPAYALMTPTNDNVLIRQIPADTQTKGGILIPASAQEKGLKGEVVQVGPGRWDADHGRRLPMDATVGVVVLFDKYAGTPLTIEGEDYLLMSEKYILLYL